MEKQKTEGVIAGIPAIGPPSLHRRRRGILILLCSTYPFTNAGHPRRSRATMLMLDGLLPKCGSRRNTISLPASLRASYRTRKRVPGTRIALDFANSAGHIRPQTCELPFGPFLLAHSNPGHPASTAGSAPSVLEDATREKFFLLSTSTSFLGNSPECVNENETLFSNI